MSMHRTSAPARILALVLGAASIAAGDAAADQVFYSNVEVQGSLCAGLDCLPNLNYGFDTIILRENNLRILFQDTSTSPGFPTNDWRLIANDSAAGGAAYFAIEDATAARQVFRVDAGAPANSLLVGPTGQVGLGTATPILDLHIANTNTPAVRFEQNASAGFTAQIWDIAGNDANFFIRDVTGGSRLPFRIRPGAPTSSIDVAASGDVGFGAPPTTGQQVDVTGGVTMTGGLHVGNIPTYGTNACRSTRGQTVPNFYSIGDCASDARLKHDIAALPDGALEKVLALKPATFGWNGDPSSTRHAGFIAQDTLPHVPEAVGISQTDGYYTWDSNAVLSYTVKALQELNRKVDGLAAPGDVGAVRLTGSATGSELDALKLQGVVTELVAVIKEQQRRIEALERTITARPN
jgi:hypothetical protein